MVVSSSIRGLEVMGWGGEGWLLGSVGLGFDALTFGMVLVFGLGTCDVLNYGYIF